MKKTKEQLIKELSCVNKRLKRIQHELKLLTGGKPNRCSDHIYYACVYVDGAERCIGEIREQ